jgi:acyl carrier protein
VPNPFTKERDDRLYKTGDLARYLPDGTIECLGRMDHQVKIRGFRVEPGEIESVLLQCSDIRQALVMAREDVPGDKRLVAYIVARVGAKVSLSKLRELLRTKLPDYMVPADYVLLNNFPLTPAGKVDRQKLPAPEPRRAEGRPGYIAPRTPLEEDIAAIWQEVFHLPRVGVQDGFLELGGHSLTAVQVIVRIQEKVGVELPLQTLFEVQTVAGLAEAIFNQLAARESEDELGQLLKKVEGLSEEEAKRLLELEQTKES